MARASWDRHTPGDKLVCSSAGRKVYHDGMDSYEVTSPAYDRSHGTSKYDNFETWYKDIRKHRKSSPTHVVDVSNKADKKELESLRAEIDAKLAETNRAMTELKFMQDKMAHPEKYDLDNYAFGKRFGELFVPDLNKGTWEIEWRELDDALDAIWKDAQKKAEIPMGKACYGTTYKNLGYLLEFSSTKVSLCFSHPYWLSVDNEKIDIFGEKRTGQRRYSGMFGKKTEWPVSFALDKFDVAMSTADEILALLADGIEKWDAYCEKMADDIVKQKKEYEAENGWYDEEEEEKWRGVEKLDTIARFLDDDPRDDADDSYPSFDPFDGTEEEEIAAFEDAIDADAIPIDDVISAMHDWQDHDDGGVHMGYGAYHEEFDQGTWGDVEWHAFDDDIFAELLAWRRLGRPMYAA